MVDEKGNDKEVKPKNPWYGDPRLALPKILLTLGFLSLASIFVIAATYTPNTSAPYQPPPAVTSQPPPPVTSPIEATALGPLLLAIPVIGGIVAVIAGILLYRRRKKAIHQKSYDK